MGNERRCISCFRMTEKEVCEKCGYVEPMKRRDSILPALEVLVGRYVVGEVLGVDKSSVEYKAWDEEKKAVVEIQEYYPREVATRESASSAIKLISEENREVYLKNISSIKQSAAKMFELSDSPNVVKVFDCFECNNTVYIVKEYIEGMYLSDFLSSCGGSVDTETAVSIMVPVLDGLTRIHKAGLVHRALTPKSIVITVDNEVKITDFRFLKEASPYKFENMTVHFSPGYAPPEQYRSRSKQGAFSDIYSAGAILYRMLTGKKPLDALNRQTQDDLEIPAALVAGLPEYINISIMKALNLTTELRFKSAAEFKNCLIEKKEVVDVEGKIKNLKVKKFNRNTVIMLAALLVTVGLILYFLLR